MKMKLLWLQVVLCAVLLLLLTVLKDRIIALAEAKIFHDSCPPDCRPYYVKEGEKCHEGYRYWRMGNGIAVCDCPKSCPPEVK